MNDGEAGVVVAATVAVAGVVVAVVAAAVGAAVVAVVIVVAAVVRFVVVAAGPLLRSLMRDGVFCAVSTRSAVTSARLAMPGVATWPTSVVGRRCVR